MTDSSYFINTSHALHVYNIELMFKYLLLNIIFNYLPLQFLKWTMLFLTRVLDYIIVTKTK